jgi:hypothetical protein
LTDGWSDGGSDVRVSQLPPNPTSLAIQITVQKDWAGKLKEDARKVRDKLGLSDLIFISSRRVAEAPFHSLTEEIWRNTGVRVSKLDSQAIASAFFERGRTTEVLTALGIDVRQVATPGSLTSSAKLEAAYSFLFFGDEPEQFRQQIIESALVTVATKKQGRLLRNALVSDAIEMLQLPETQKELIVGSIDRMLQRGEFVAEADYIRLAASIVDAAKAVHIAREREWVSLSRAIAAVISSASGAKVSDEIISSILEDLGGLLMSTADVAFLSLERSFDRGVAQENIDRRLRHLHSSLDAIIFPEGEIRQETLQKLTEIAVSSPIGKHLVAGELYLSLSTVNTPQLIRALGARSEIRVILDSSVAIPILSCLLYEASTPHRYFDAAYQVHDLLNELGIVMVLPQEYLEEVASHLYLAYRDYSVIVDIDADLAASENAFVAHYVGLRVKGVDISFKNYLAAFGFQENLESANLPAARDILMPKLAKLFSKYNIDTVPMRWVKPRSKKQAEEMIARAVDALSLSRPQILLAHDARTLAGLMEESQRAESAQYCAHGTTYIFG